MIFKTFTVEPRIHYLHFSLILAPCVAIVTAIVSLLTPPIPKKHVSLPQKLYVVIRGNLASPADILDTVLPKAKSFALTRISEEESLATRKAWY